MWSTFTTSGFDDVIAAYAVRDRYAVHEALDVLQHDRFPNKRIDGTAKGQFVVRALQLYWYVGLCPQTKTENFFESCRAVGEASVPRDYPDMFFSLLDALCELSPYRSLGQDGLARTVEDCLGPSPRPAFIGAHGVFQDRHGNPANIVWWHLNLNVELIAKVFRRCLLQPTP